MSPAIVGLLIRGALELFTSLKANKENLKSPTTVLATLPAVAAASSVVTDGALPADNLEALITQAVTGVVALVLFFLRKPTNQ